MVELFNDLYMQRNLKGQFIKGTNGNTFEGFGVWYDDKGHPCIWVDNKSIKIHILIWERANGEKPKGFNIHHKDNNKGNFTLENLEILSESDHKRIHVGWIRKGNQWIAKPCSGCGKILSLNQFYPRKGYTPSALCKKCYYIYIRKRLSIPQNSERVRQYKHDYYLRAKSRRMVLLAE